MAGRHGGPGIWELVRTLVVFCVALHCLSPAAAQTSPGITAEHGIAAGRDAKIEGNVTLYGWTPVEVKDLINRNDAAEQEIRRLSTQLSVTDNAVRTFLLLLAEREVPVENLTLKLVEIAQTHRALLAQVRSAPSDDPHGAELKQQAARAIEQGQYERAETLLTEVRDIKLAAVRRRQEAIQREQEEADRELLEAAQAQADLGEMKGTQLQYLDASVAFTQAAELVPPEHPLVRADYLNRAGWRAMSAGQYQAAVDPLTEALAIREKALGPDHPDVALTVNNLAALHWNQGRYAEAEPLYQRALTINEKAFGLDHPNVAMNLNNLAALHWNQGRYAEAEPLLRRALAISEKAFGPDHPNVALTVNNLAALYWTQGQYAEAEPLYQRALTINEKALGPEHPSTRTIRKNLSTLQSELATAGNEPAATEKAPAD